MGRCINIIHWSVAWLVQVRPLRGLCFYVASMHVQIVCACVRFTSRSSFPQSQQAVWFKARITGVPLNQEKDSLQMCHTPASSSYSFRLSLLLLSMGRENGYCYRLPTCRKRAANDYQHTETVVTQLLYLFICVFWLFSSHSDEFFFFANSPNTPIRVFGIREQTVWPTSLTAPRGTVCWACCAGHLSSALSSPSVPPWLRACKMSSPGMTFTTRPQYGAGRAGMYGLFSSRWMVTAVCVTAVGLPKGRSRWEKSQQRPPDVNQAPDKEMLRLDVLVLMVLRRPDPIKME